MKPRDGHKRGTRAQQPIAALTALGVVYVVTDEEDKWERCNGVTWQDVTPGATAVGLGPTSSPTFNNLTLSGDLTVNGVSTTLNTDNLTVEDPLIKLASNNVANTLDIGIYGKYQPVATPLYAGLFRDATDGVFKLFSGLQTEPGTTVNIAGTGFEYANLTMGPALNVGSDLSTATAAIQIGNGRTGDGICHIDLVGDTTYSDFGLRMIRNNGANANSTIFHRGTGLLRLVAQDAGSLGLWTSNTSRMAIDSAGVVSIGANVSFDQTAANNENPVISQFVVTDGGSRHRKASIAHVQASLGIVAGSGNAIASGNLSTVLNNTTINIPAGSWAYVDIVLNSIVTNLDFACYLRINADSTPGNYRYAQLQVNTNNGTVNSSAGGTAPTSINLWSTASEIEGTSNSFSTTIRIYNPAGSTRKQMDTRAAGTIAASDGVVYHANGTAYWASTAAITSVTVHLTNTAAQVQTGAGVLAVSGTYQVYGYS